MTPCLETALEKLPAILDCGHHVSPHSPITTGYATTPDGRRVCYDCADQATRDDLRDRSRPFCGYLSSDLAHVTTWTGGALMRVLSASPCQLTRTSYTHDRKSYKAIHAVDVHGGHWYGRGSAGIAIRLRPCSPGIYANASPCSLL